MITRIHHFGVAVKDLEKARAEFEARGFVVETSFVVPAINAKVLMMALGNHSHVELFEFEDPNDELAIKIQHHKAFATDDIEADVAAFLADGYEIAMPIADGNAVKKWAYVTDKNGNYFELCEPLEGARL